MTRGYIHMSRTSIGKKIRLFVICATVICSGWWFGTSILFSHILGISSSQLTNYIVQRGGPTTTKPCCVSGSALEFGAIFQARIQRSGERSGLVAVCGRRFWHRSCPLLWLQGQLCWWNHLRRMCHSSHGSPVIVLFSRKSFETQDEGFSFLECHSLA